MRKGLYHGFGYLSLVSDPLDLTTYIENYCNFSTVHRVVDTKTSSIEIGPNILKCWLENDNNFRISQNILADLKRLKGKYNLHGEAF